MPSAVKARSRRTSAYEDVSECRFRGAVVGVKFPRSPTPERVNARVYGFSFTLVATSARVETDLAAGTPERLIPFQLWCGFS
jgi:hypothetical protein